MEDVNAKIGCDNILLKYVMEKRGLEDRSGNNDEKVFVSGFIR